MSIVTRFAPSPTGRLHLGHVFSLFYIEEFANSHAADSRILLRIEDIDSARCKPEYFDEIIEDMKWLGVKFSGQMLMQSKRWQVYDKFFHLLEEVGLVYPCICSRKDIINEIKNSYSAPQGSIYKNIQYPGTCRNLSSKDLKNKSKESYCWRLNLEKATKLHNDLSYVEWPDSKHKLDFADLGDPVIIPKNEKVSYHLASVVDDSLSLVNHVIRGEDMRNVLPIHIMLQSLFGTPSPIYLHHPLVNDASGKRLAKRKGSLSLDAWRNNGYSANNLRDLYAKWRADSNISLLNSVIKKQTIK